MLGELWVLGGCGEQFRIEQNLHKLLTLFELYEKGQFRVAAWKREASYEANTVLVGSISEILTLARGPAARCIVWWKLGEQR